jgi:hypothetical protein
MRLSFQAFSDSVSSFAADAALAIAQHAGPAPEDLELVRRMALAELKTSRDADKAQGEVKTALEQLQGEDIRNLGSSLSVFFKKIYTDILILCKKFSKESKGYTSHTPSKRLKDSVVVFRKDRVMIESS